MEELIAGDRPSWTAARVARPAGDLALSVRFYHDLVGLPSVGGFHNHAGYDGVFFGLPGGAELELTAGPARPAASTEEDLLVLYVDTYQEVESAGARLRAAGVTRVASPNPYWNRTGQTYLDPDGYRLVVAMARSGTDDPRPSSGLRSQQVPRSPAVHQSVPIHSRGVMPAGRPAVRIAVVVAPVASTGELAAPARERRPSWPSDRSS